MAEGIQFLRGAGSRATFMLPAFYMLAGSSYLPTVPGEQPLWRSTQVASLHFSALQTISLVCRSIFDESRKKSLTGKLFAKASDQTLEGIAEHWSNFSDQPIEDALKALTLLRDLFRRCAQPKKSLLDGESLLERRVGLLKYHADRQAAHLTLEPHLIGLVDIVHVVATVTIVGTIIVDFDQPRLGPRYFNSLDEAGWNAAKSIFPDLSMARLFHQFDIHAQARLYWRHHQFEGLKMLLTHYPQPSDTGTVATIPSRCRPDDVGSEAQGARVL
ncbi:MAG: hypothetical protein WBW93_13485 [Steroidobacteraceae bacterium]